MPRNESADHELERVKEERDAAVSDLERLMWITGCCKYCAENKSKTGQHRKLDNPCRVCEPVWRGKKERRKPWDD